MIVNDYTVRNNIDISDSSFFTCSGIISFYGEKYVYVR